jgi:hypothetical protein
MVCSSNHFFTVADCFVLFNNSSFQINPLSLKKAELTKYYNLKAPLGIGA